MAAAATTDGSWARWAAGAIAGINVFDCLFTLSFLQLGLCQEANPFMRGLYECSPWLFIATKLVVVNGSVALLVRLASRPMARAALLLGATVYAALAAYELTGLVGHLHQV